MYKIDPWPCHWNPILLYRVSWSNIQWFPPSVFFSKYVFLLMFGCAPLLPCSISTVIRSNWQHWVHQWSEFELSFFPCISRLWHCSPDVPDSPEEKVFHWHSILDGSRSRCSWEERGIRCKGESRWSSFIATENYVRAGLCVTLCAVWHLGCRHHRHWAGWETASYVWPASNEGAVPYDQEELQASNFEAERYVSWGAVVMVLM